MEEKNLVGCCFWNSRRTDNDADSYESNLSEFHQALNANKPEGFRFSATYRVAKAPWFTQKTRSTKIGIY